MKRLFLIRGLPGSGKSTLAEYLMEGINAKDDVETTSISTDDCFLFGSQSWQKMLDLAERDNSYDWLFSLPIMKEIAEGTLEPEFGEYVFIPEVIRYAHKHTQNRVKSAMREPGTNGGNEYEAICVHNTFSVMWEAQAYFDMAKENGYQVFVLECQNSFGSIHNVPVDTFQRMRERWTSLSSR